MFEDPELQDPLTLSINDSYQKQNLSPHDQRTAPPGCDYGCEAPHIRVVIKEEEEGWTVTETNESDFFRGETADDSPKVWDPHFSAHGKESCDSYDVEEESSSSVVCDPGCSAKPEVFRARGTTAELTVVECSNTGEESVPHPVRKTTTDQDWKSNLHRGSNPDADRFLPEQNQDVEQRTCLPTGAEPHHTNTSAFCQIASPGCKSVVTTGLTMTSSDLEEQTLRLTVKLQAEEVEGGEGDEEIGGFINSDGEVFDWDDSPDRGSDPMESPQRDQGHDLCQALPGPTQRYSSPTLIMEVVGDDDEKIEVKDKDVSHLESEKRQRERRKKNKVSENPVSPINDSDTEKLVIRTPEKRRSKRKISEVPPSYEGLDAEPEVSRRTRKRKKVPTTEESKPKTVPRTTERTRQVKQTWKKTKESRPSAEGGENVVVPAVKKTPGRKRLCVPVEIPPELLKKPKEKIDYQCSVCGKEFPHAYKLERHELIHTGEKPYCCSICGRGFNQKGNLKTHYKVHYGQKGVPDFEDEVTPIASELSEYLKSLPGESKIRSSLQCLECGTDCKSQSSSEGHHIAAHAQTASEPDAAEHHPPHDLICHRCDIQFKDKEKLDEHMKTHVKEKRFACPDCGKRFINESYIHIHRRIHTGERPYLCSQCGRGFHTASSLKIHEVQHSEERPFACSICGKRFRMNSYLVAHYQTHIIDRPYICSVCGKGYSRIEELKVHQRLHTGERPYECGECGKSFIYRQGLRQHQRTHAGRRMGPTRQLGRPKQQARPDVQQ